MRPTETARLLVDALGVEGALAYARAEMKREGKARWGRVVEALSLGRDPSVVFHERMARLEREAAKIRAAPQAPKPSDLPGTGVKRTFYLGAAPAAWLGELGVPLFIARQSLAERKKLPRARAPWALDSGGFTELQKHGRWTVSAREYVDQVRRFRDEIGMLQWAAAQDWMCEPIVIAGGKNRSGSFAGTGLDVPEHIRRTVQNYLDLKSLAPDIPWMPTLQGWNLHDYRACRDLYEHYGVRLQDQPIVGIGSVCRREETMTAARYITDFAQDGIRLHGFGIKKQILALSANELISADSQAWSYAARKRRREDPCPEGKAACNNCKHWALEWRDELLAGLGPDWQQPRAANPGASSSPKREAPLFLGQINHPPARLPRTKRKRIENPRSNGSPLSRLVEHLTGLYEGGHDADFDADEIEQACVELGIRCLVSSDREYVAVGGHVLSLPYDVEDNRSERAADFAAETDEIVAASFGVEPPDFSPEFWAGPSPLYHATTEENAESIESEGLAPASETRGISNRGVGAAVFTTLEIEETEDGSYGDVVYRIDTAAMKRDGVTPAVSLEPPVEEEAWRSSLAHKLGAEDFVWDVEYGISPHTVIVHGSIPAKYLTRIA